MKKKITMIAIALAGVFGLTANAQDACQKQGKCGEATQCQAGDMNKMRQPREFTEFAFEGILLDINQQTRIDSLNNAVKANMPARQEMSGCQKAEGCEKAGKECNKGSDKKCDKAGKDCDKQKCDKKGKDCDKKCDKKCDKAGKDCKGEGNCKKGGHKGHMAKVGRPGAIQCPYGQEYIAKVKEILTPEQYTTFLENIVAMGPRMGAPVGMPMAQPRVKAEGCQDKGDCQMKGHHGMQPKQLPSPKK